MSARDVLDRWQALADGATEGPWRTTQEGLTHPSGWDIAGPRGPVASECCGYTGSVSDRPDAEFIAAARTIVPAAVKALRAVLDLHQPYTWHNDTPRKGMRQWGPGVGAEGEGTCDVERETWPCPTVRAIEAAIGGEGATRASLLSARGGAS